MRQNIKFQHAFSDSGFSLELKEVYEVNQTLYAIAKVIYAPIGMEVMTPRQFSVNVDTSSNETLPVKYFALVSDNLKSAKSFGAMKVVKSRDDIPELSNQKLSPLSTVIAGMHKFWQEPSFKGGMLEGDTYKNIPSYKC